MPLIEHFILAAAVLLLVSVLSSKATGRFGVPALLIFLAIGMLAGSEGLGQIPFDNAFVAQTIGIVALSFILFAGGISTDWKSVQPLVRQGLALSTLGVLITALVMGVLARMVVDLSWGEALILGAIVSSTDAAAVFSIMRSKSVSLKGRLRPLLELESGSNDPMAVFLTVGFISLFVNPDKSFISLVPGFVLQMSVGAAFGYGSAKLYVYAMNRMRLEYEGLYSVFSIGFALIAYSLTTTLGGNGFLAVYILGLLLGRSDFIHKNSVIRYHDGIAWLMQISMFLVLGLLVFPSHLVPVARSGLLLSLLLMLIARPISVFVALSVFRDFELRERIMISWVGLRGAAPIILATFPLLAGLEKSEIIFNLVFFIVLTSVLIQGTLIPVVAKKLRLDAPLDEGERPIVELVPTESMTARLHELRVHSGARAAGKQLVELNFPRRATIVLVTRGGHHLVPKGNTVLEPGDRVLVLSEPEEQKSVQDLIERKLEL